MEITALILWVITALGGFTMLGIWMARGGTSSGTSRLPVPVLFGHFGLAAAGLVVWIIYLVNDSDALAWTAFVLLLPVALLGLTMFARWLPAYRGRAAAPAGAAGADAPTVAREQALPEEHFPVVLVAGHGILAVATVVLVLLTALGVGDS